MSEFIPQSVGIIMDGNRRWAKQKGLLPWEGHKAGRETFRQLRGWAKQAGVETLICYAFSTENWNRPQEEIEEIQKLFVEALEDETSELVREGVALRVIGERSRFSDALIQKIIHAETATAGGGQTLAIAFSYGGRGEIVSAVNRLIVEDKEVVTEEDLSKALFTSGMKDPDLIIRTGGQHRLSNFLLWQAAYSELWFTDTLWPDFTEQEFKEALTYYANCKRNFGA